ncbi:MAG: hypothetical protein H8F28_12140 [Fibrella sp.]|nr:hypothetical protein [Armatimonadota bacterium]
MSNSFEDFTERPHPGDVTAAEANHSRRRLVLGLMIALSLNIAFLTGGAAIANYVSAIFRPFFFKTDKMVYVTLDVTPSPSPTPPSSVE